MRMFHFFSAAESFIPIWKDKPTNNRLCTEPHFCNDQRCVCAATVRQNWLHVVQIVVTIEQCDVRTQMTQMNALNNAQYVTCFILE